MSDVYLILTRAQNLKCSTFYVEFSNSIEDAMNALDCGGRVFKLNTLTELDKIAATYEETPKELT